MTLRRVATAVALLLVTASAHAQQQQPQERRFTLNVTAAQVSLLGRALAELPYKDVGVLIDQLRTQIAGQDSPPQDQTPSASAPQPKGK